MIALRLAFSEVMPTIVRAEDAIGAPTTVEGLYRAVPLQLIAIDSDDALQKWNDHWLGVCHGFWER